MKNQGINAGFLVILCKGSLFLKYFLEGLVIGNSRCKYLKLFIQKQN